MHEIALFINQPFYGDKEPFGERYANRNSFYTLYIKHRTATKEEGMRYPTAAKEVWCVIPGGQAVV